MNKNILPVICILMIISCQTKVEPLIEANVDDCENCSMIIQNVDHGAAAIDAEEQLHTFCNPVCMLIEKNRLKNSDAPAPMDRYLFDHVSLSAVPVSRAYIVHGDFPTAMGHGLLAFANKDDAAAFVEEMDGELLSWNDLRLKYEFPDVEISLSDEVENIEVNKNDLVSVAYYNRSPEDVLIKLYGYDFEMAVPADSEVTGHFIAEKPGQGFVFRKNDDEELATLFVAGEHTSEEAIYK